MKNQTESVLSRRVLQISPDRFADRDDAWQIAGHGRFALVSFLSSKKQGRQRFTTRHEGNKKKSAKLSNRGVQGFLT